MQFVFYFIIAAFVTFYLCKIKYSVFIDQDISVLSAQTTFIYDLGIIIFTFILLTYCLYYTYLFNKIRIKEVLQANGYDDKNFELNLTTHSMEYEKYKKIYRQIVTYLEEQALYLDPEFSSTRMAQDLNINISYLSKAIQLHSGMNFNRLVNSYRINKVKETLSTNLQSYTMQYIYMSSGFKSQSAFNKAFKMQEGITPSEYIKTLPN
ncbi:MAG: AraC family transcriptional regulator [Bacteroidales bacterium]|nr:AraC family transcriptional regulator [Bacteroidales bacterium]